MASRLLAAIVTWTTVAPVPPALAQTFPTDDPVIRQIWAEGMTEKSQAGRLAQILMDSIGPRLTGSPGHAAAGDWLQRVYREWGIPVRAERYGTWHSWKRGHTHLDLLAPRSRTLEAVMLAWSPGTPGPIEGEAVLLPDVATESEFLAWLPAARGRFVLTSFAEPTCRPDENWERLARPESVQRMKEQRDRDRAAWSQRRQHAGPGLITRLDSAGVAGILTSTWSQGWGVNKVFTASTTRAPSLDLSCEDYGLLFRLAANAQGPRLRLDASSESLGEVPVFNVVGEIRGVEEPEEIVLLGAHLDSYDAASGATDNGTGTVTMLEAMRLLKAAYPSPKRTIMVGHWGGEEQGLIGSRAFAEDHPEVVNGLQAAFNQDNGTWRVEYIRMMGLVGAGEFFARWLSRVPPEIEGRIDLDMPGVPETGGSDHMAFLCHGAPSFRLQSHYPDYRQYTWHTNRDTYDKVILDDLRNNATLAAMLAYQAAEDPERVPRTKRVMPSGPDGHPRPWPACTPARRTSP
jgi:hypothetical protein